MREAVRRRAPGLPCGLWVLRLRAGFDVRQFPSAASRALRDTVRAELDAMLAGATR
jgi:ribonuclease P protein component